MPTKCSFATVFFFNTKHQRTNKLSHLSIGIMEADKDEVGHLQNIRLVNSYGYYSHKIPDGAETTFFDRFLKKAFNVSFRIHRFYAEFKQEDLINMDLGFGLSCGPIIEITSEERQTLEHKISEIFENERKFFCDADQAARDAVPKETKPDKQAREFEERKNLSREHYYQKAVEEVDQLVALHPEANFKDAETAYSSGQISRYRLQQEKLKTLTGVPIFEFVPSPNGSTCKTLGTKLVIQSLSDDESGKIRKSLFSNLLDGYYTQAIPILTPGLSKILYNSLQDSYSNNQIGKVRTPNRTWNQETTCLLVGTEQNIYIDLAGNKHQLQSIDRKKEYFDLLENLFHLKRLLNDFTDQPDFNNYIKIIDKSVLDIMQVPSNIHAVIRTYHATLHTLAELHCFDNIAQHIFNIKGPLDKVRTLKCPKNLRLESGVAAELYRLQRMAKQAKQPELTLENLVGIREKIFSLFHHQTLPSHTEPTLGSHHVLAK